MNHPEQNPHPSTAELYRNLLRAWVFALALAGNLLSHSLCSAQDSDNDGLPDAWEILYGLEPHLSDKNQTGDGSDGALMVPVGTTHVLQTPVTSLVGAHPAGNQSLTVADGSLFGSGDLAFVWVAQDPNTDPIANTAGTYDICRVMGRTGNILQVSKPTRRAFDGSGGRLVIVQKIPEFTTVAVDGTLECPAWDGSKGGLLALTARNLVIGPTGKVSADGKGFRGGADYAQADVDGFQGESYLGGYGARSVNAKAGGGGGGGRSWQYAGNGGGGGGHVTTGGTGGFLWDNTPDRETARIGGAGGVGHGIADLSRIYLGSGGGSGGQDGDNPNDGQMNGGAGGKGGGVVLVFASEIANSGIIAVNGENGSAGQEERGYGGGGSGGSLYLTVAQYSGLGAIIAGAGSGGQHANIFGGNGSVGRIRFDLPTGATVPTSQPPVGYSGDFLNAFSEGGFDIGEYHDADLDGLDTLEEFHGNTNPFSPDTDADGLPDKWEIDNGGNPTLADALADTDGDRIPNREEYHAGTKGNFADTDSDGLNDGIELLTAGTNPLSSDTDGDGMPDKWEVDHGLDPRRDDRTEDRDSDFLSNWDEFVAGLNPALADSNGNGTPDFRQLRGNTTWDALYDRNDRLLGVRHERGASFGYAYDGNGNPVRQVKLGRDTDGDGLSDLWEFANGTDPKSPDGLNGLGGDLDGDGWTNLQEMLGQSDPASAASRPGSSGLLLPAVPFPFTPTRYAIGTGQMDFAGTAEIAIGADGNPGTAENFIRLYRQSGGNWIHEDIPVGAYGVTSLCIGVLPGRQPAIYAGFRKTGGSGRIVELTKGATGWQTYVVAESLAEDAWVHGFRGVAGAAELAMGLHTPYGPDGALYRFTTASGSARVGLVDPLVSQKGAGLIWGTGESGVSDLTLRRLNSGGIQVAVPFVYTIPGYDEFNDIVIDSPPWTKGGTTSPTESSGLGKVETSWPSGGGADSWMQRDLVWPRDSSGLEIRLPLAQHSQSGSRFGGEARVLLGATVIYGSGQNRTDSNIDLQVVRGATQIFFRRRINGGAWGDWTGGASGTTLRFEASGSDVGSSSFQGSVSLQVDWIRFRRAADLLAEGKSGNDYSASEAAYHASSNTLFLRTTSAMTWRDAQLHAFSRGGGLATLDDPALNSWLQGKFSGELWNGLYRQSASAPWTWVGGGPMTQSAWAAGQPGTTASDLYAFSNNGQWSSATGAELKPAVFALDSSVADTRITNEPEPSATSRLAWPGRGLAAGRFHSSLPTQSSLVQVFLDDKDTSGTATAGDEFVLSEREIGASGSDFRTLVKRSLSAGAGPGFGVASVRPRGGGSDFIATAEPDGQVTVWLPVSAGGALQRKPLTFDHAGMHWHGLERFAIAGGLEGMAGLRVDPSAPGSVRLVLWNANDLGFTTPPVIQQSPPKARILAGTPTSGGKVALNTRVWDSEGNISRLALEWKDPTLSSWSPATVAGVNGVPQALGFTLASSPGGTPHSLTWHATQDVGSSFRGTVLLRIQAADSGGAGEWSEPFAYTIGGLLDSDGDGMPDQWETDNGLNHVVSDALGDMDRDGLQNIMEFALGRRANLPDAHGAIKLELVGGYPVMTINRNPDAAHLEFTVEVSEKLVQWNSGAGYCVVLEDVPGRLKVRGARTVGEMPDAHFRLKVGYRPP